MGHVKRRDGCIIAFIAFHVRPCRVAGAKQRWSTPGWIMCFVLCFPKPKYHSPGVFGDETRRKILPQPSTTAVYYTAVPDRKGSKLLFLRLNDRGLLYDGEIASHPSGSPIGRCLGERIPHQTLLSKRRPLDRNVGRGNTIIIIILHKYRRTGCWLGTTAARQKRICSRTAEGKLPSSAALKKKNQINLSSGQNGTGSGLRALLVPVRE